MLYNLRVNYGSLQLQKFFYFSRSNCPIFKFINFIKTLKRISERLIFIEHLAKCYCNSFNTNRVYFIPQIHDLTILHSVI